MYDQLSLLDLLPAPTPPEPAPEPAPDPAPDPAPTGPYYPINEGTAKAANDANSMRDYTPGSATAEYRAAVDEAAALVSARKSKISPFYHDKLDRYLDSYSRRLADWTNANNRNEAACPSILICGGSNFPTRKKAKQNARRDTLWAEYQEIQSILDKIKSIGTGPVDLTDPHARELLTDRLRNLETSLEECKAANAHYRKHKTLDGCTTITPKELEWLTRPGVFNCGDTGSPLEYHGCPYPSYTLTGIRDKIKRTRSRLEELDRLEAAKSNPDPATDYDGFQLIRNAAENRLQIIFDELPDPELREKLKRSGFRWSPKNQAWQRQLTDNAERAARSILGIG